MRGNTVTNAEELMANPWQTCTASGPRSGMTIGPDNPTTCEVQIEERKEESKRGIERTPTDRDVAW